MGRAPPSSLPRSAHSASFGVAASTPSEDEEVHPSLVGRRILEWTFRALSFGVDSVGNSPPEDEYAPCRGKRNSALHPTRWVASVHDPTGHGGSGRARLSSRATGRRRVAITLCARQLRRRAVCPAGRRCRVRPTHQYIAGRGGDRAWNKALPGTNLSASLMASPRATF